MKKVAIFCDGGNIYHGLGHAHPGRRLDYGGLFDKIVTCLPDRELLRVYYYLAIPPVEPQASQTQKFISFLQRLPYVEVRHKKLASYTDSTGATKWREKGIDVQIAVDMVNMAYQGLYDVAALISGDADLVPGVMGVKLAGKHAENYFFSGSQSLEMRQHADRSQDLSSSWLGTLLTTKVGIWEAALSVLAGGPASGTGRRRCTASGGFDAGCYSGSLTGGLSHASPGNV